MRQLTNSRCLRFGKERLFLKENDYIKMSDLKDY